jgi:hypothetical protein
VSPATKTVGNDATANTVQLTASSMFGASSSSNAVQDISYTDDSAAVTCDDDMMHTNGDTAPSARSAIAEQAVARQSNDMHISCGSHSSLSRANAAALIQNVSVAVAYNVMTCDQRLFSVYYCTATCKWYMRCTVSGYVSTAIMQCVVANLDGLVKTALVVSSNMSFNYIAA